MRTETITGTGSAAPTIPTPSATGPVADPISSSSTMPQTMVTATTAPSTPIRAHQRRCAGPSGPTGTGPDMTACGGSAAAFAGSVATCPGNGRYGAAGWPGTGATGC